MLHDHGYDPMNINLKYPTADVLRTCKENREKHVIAAAKAKQDYRAAALIEFEEKKAAAIKEMNAKIKAAKEEGGAIHRLTSIDLSLDLPLPEDHTEDYDRAIAMLSMTEEKVLVLTPDQFRQLVLDQWSWKQTFEFSNTSYGTKVAQGAQVQRIREKRDVLIERR